MCAHQLIIYLSKKIEPKNIGSRLSQTTNPLRQNARPGPMRQNARLHREKMRAPQSKAHIEKLNSPEKNARPHCDKMRILIEKKCAHPLRKNARPHRTKMGAHETNCAPQLRQNARTIEKNSGTHREKCAHHRE